MDRIVTFLLLLVSALLLVPGCIAEEQVAPEATEVVPEVPVVEEATEEVVEEVAGEVQAEEVTEVVAEELPVYNVTANVNSTEINMTGDILQAGQVKRIIMCMMPVVGHQSALIALGMIVLAKTKTIVNQ